jgi:subtilisin family serine protease
MPRFIVRPDKSLATRAVGLISKQFTPARRQAQIAEVVSLRREDPAFGDLYKWLNDSPAAVMSLNRESETLVTGTKIVDMSDQEAARLRQEMPNVLVLRDQPMSLIQPVKATLDTQTRVTVADLWHLKAIGLAQARQNGFTGTGKGVTVAVLDTGIDATHPELAGRVRRAARFDVDAWQAVPLDPSVDTEGHGTHVAGLVCGQKVGIAPEAEVINGLMLPNGHGNISDFILALEWAGTQPDVQIVNMSAGIPGYHPEMLTAIADLLAIGVLPVIATGNEGRDQTRSPGNYAESLAVGASNAAKRVASFSSGGVIVADNHRYEVPDLVAPGEAVFSCVMGGGYEAWNGTSMATPIVSGVAALILEKFPEITVTDLIEELILSCKTLGASPDRQGHGLVQVKPAL